MSQFPPAQCHMQETKKHSLKDCVFKVAGAGLEPATFGL